MDFKKILFKTNELDMEHALPDGTVFCAKEGKILWVNDKAADIFETSKMHLMTSNISDFIENSINLISMAISYDKPVIAKFAGKELYFEMTGRETEEGYVLAFRDTNAGSADNPLVSPRIQSDIPNRAGQSFILKLANDFKAPLQSIVGFSQAMADGLGGNISEQQEKYIRIIRKNSSELMYFTDKLMEMFKSETDTFHTNLKIFDILNLINSVVRFNEHLHKEKALKWNVFLEDGMKNTMISDEGILKNILQNICEVILKTVEAGEIIISAQVPDETILNGKNLVGTNYVMFTVSCSSMLLSENDLESMFDPYKIVDSPNRKNLLRAITLLSVKNLTDKLNGLVWIESKILKNTTFNVIIPNGIKG